MSIMHNKTATDSYKQFWKKETSLFLRSRYVLLLIFSWIVGSFFIFLFFYFHCNYLTNQEALLQKTLEQSKKNKAMQQSGFLADLPISTLNLRQGYVTYLDFLSSFKADGVWLNELEIDLSAGKLKIQGRSVNFSSLDHFLEQLNKEHSPFLLWSVSNSSIYIGDKKEKEENDAISKWIVRPTLVPVEDKKQEKVDTNYSFILNFNKK